MHAMAAQGNSHISFGLHLAGFSLSLVYMQVGLICITSVGVVANAIAVDARFQELRSRAQCSWTPRSA